MTRLRSMATMRESLSQPRGGPTQATAMKMIESMAVGSAAGDCGLNHSSLQWTAIACSSGRGGSLPWRISAGLVRRFKTLTMGHHLMMGRKTLESLPRLLPGRTSLVISRTQEPGARGPHRTKPEAPAKGIWP